MQSNVVFILCGVTMVASIVWILPVFYYRNSARLLNVPIGFFQFLKMKFQGNSLLTTFLMFSRTREFGVRLDWNDLIVLRDSGTDVDAMMSYLIAAKRVGIDDMDLLLIDSHRLGIDVSSIVESAGNVETLREELQRQRSCVLEDS